MEYEFRNCGATGRIGPTLTQINATYTESSTLYLERWSGQIRYLP